MATDKRKQSIYLSEELTDLVQAEAESWNVSFSRIIQDCVEIARTSTKTRRPKGIVAFTEKGKK